MIAGSAPGAALFFVTYESTKNYLSPAGVEQTGARSAMSHMIAASMGEIAACSVRVPTEVVKQRAQASQFSSSWLALRNIFTANQGAVRVWAELYRGWGVTVMREIPFTVIQFPLWEALKEWRGRTVGRKANAMESAVFGSASGAVAAAATTPLDVLKTRLMLAEKVSTIRHGGGGVANEDRNNLLLRRSRRLWRRRALRPCSRGLAPGLSGFRWAGQFSSVLGILQRIC